MIVLLAVAGHNLARMHDLPHADHRPLLFAETRVLGSGGIVWHRAEDEEDLGAKATQLVEDMREEARALAAEYGTPL